MDSIAEREEQPTLNEESLFHFSCNDSLPCFTQCCRDVNIYLTPYDVLRLRRALKLGSAAFLARYTRHFLDRSTNIPIVQLAMAPETLRCQLLSLNGCTVYQDRPWACRMYPLDITGKAGTYRIVAGSERCLGLQERTPRTIAQWLVSQGVASYVEMEDAFHQVMPQGFLPGSDIGEGLGRVLFLAFDLDRFAELLQDGRFHIFYDVDEALLSQVQTDDEALLRLAFRYIRSQMDELYPLSRIK